MSEAIIKLSSLGDIIHLALLLPMFENQEREWFVDESFSDILKNSPYISCIHSLPIKRLFQQKDYKGLYDCFKALKLIPAYDRIIDAQGLIKSGIVTACLSSQRKLGFSFSSAKEGLASWFYHEHCHIGYHEHILHRNAKLLFQAYYQPYDVTMLNHFLDTKKEQNMIALDASMAAKNKINDLIPQSSEKILFVLEASKVNKIYPAKQFLELAKLLQKENRNIYLLWHDDEMKAQNMIKVYTNLICLPKLSLDEVKALILKMDLVIGGDTGVVHLAFALNTASITLFGNTPIERFALIGPFNQALRATNGKNYDKNDFSIATISPQDIAAMAETLLSKVKQ